MRTAPLQSVRPLGWAFAALTAAGFALMVLGAMVRAHGAGLACPDWPLCFGRAIPAFDVRVAFEWSHRALAGAVALGLAGTSVAVLRRAALRRVARPLAAAWLLLAVQVLLGGLTVIFRLAPWTVTAHLLVGTSFCVALLWSARDLFEAEAGGAPERARAPLQPTALGAVGLAALLLGLQLALGGMVSSHAAGLACAHFPTCDGESLAPTLTGAVGLHVVHRLNAYALLASFALLALRTPRGEAIGRLARVALNLTLFQIGLGALNVLMRLPVEVTALHSATAAALALATALIVREALYARSAAGRAAREPGRARVQVLEPG